VKKQIEEDRRARNAKYDEKHEEEMKAKQAELDEIKGIFVIFSSDKGSHISLKI